MSPGASSAGDPAPAPPLFRVDVTPTTSGWRFTVTEQGGIVDVHDLSHGFTQGEFALLYRSNADTFGLRPPKAAMRAHPWPANLDIEPLLTTNVHPDLRYGYGDPGVLNITGEDSAAYAVVVTSNDAPNAFPILTSCDARDWHYRGCAFPQGQLPKWAAAGTGVADFWAPELHRIGESYWLCFTGRSRDGRLAIGLAKADRVTGPFAASPLPLLEGDVIDAHLLADEEGPYLFWKDDRNGLWPGLLTHILALDPAFAYRLFDTEPDRRTALYYAALAPWIMTLTAMQRFIALHPLIEAVTADLARFSTRVDDLCRSNPTGAPLVVRMREALTTTIVAQRVDPQTMALVGDQHLIISNDQEWEAHLVEGPWVHHQDGTYYLFYAGNDFSTDRYGIGCAVSDKPLGPYRKLSGPFLRSSPEWSGPGHPSVALDPARRPYLFFHAYHPGRTGYGTFRALLRARLELSPDRVAIGVRARETL